MISASTSRRAGPHPIIAWLFSSIGKKTIVALTGIILVLFAIGHLGGNLTFFLGPDWINAYGVHLRELGPLLWVARIGLLVAVGLHIFFTMLLWKENQAARPSKYQVNSRVQSSIGVRTMRMTGLIIFGFVVFHLAQFTWLFVDPGYAGYHYDLHGQEVHNIFRMLVAGFSNPIVSIFYVLSLALLAFHLSHGIGSLFQTLGITNKRLRPVFEIAGKIIAWGLFIGFSSIPISVLVFGYGKEVL